MLHLTSSPRPHLTRIFAIVVLACCFALAVQAQAALDGFDPNANDQIEVIVVQPDGKILIGGAFTTLAPNGGPSVTRNRIARLNPDGTLDTAFNVDVDFSVLAIALQTDGKIIIGGGFTMVGGQTRNYVERLDGTTGVPDSFNPNADNFVFAVAVQNDGKILIGGSFVNISGIERYFIARLDHVTGLPDSFFPGADNSVSTILIQSDGKILVGGTFGLIGGQSRSCIARIDPNTSLADPMFNPNANNLVTTIAIQADGKILAGGWFRNIGGQARNYLARLDSVNGSADSFNPNINLGGLINSVVVQPDGKILAGGHFTTIGGQMRNRIARLDSVTGLADSFNPNVNNSVFEIAVQSDGKILIGGFFNGTNSVGIETRNRLARLERDGRLDRTLGLGIDNGGGSIVFATAVQPDGKILIGGDFTSIGGQFINRLARFNTDGTFDTTFNPNADSDVYSIAVQPDGKILVGGFFITMGGQSRRRMARVNSDGTLDTAFNPNIGNDFYVRTIATQLDGKIVVGGNFQSVGGQTRNFIARLHPDGSLDSTFAPNASFFVESVAIQTDGKILVGGGFQSIGGQTRNRIARLNSDGSLDASFNPNADGSVYSLAIQSDGKILVGGGFSMIGGQPRNGIARLNSNGTLDLNFDPNAESSVLSITLQSNGKILVAGWFASIGGQSRGFLARLNGNGTVDTTFNANAVFDVRGFVIQSDGKEVAGGVFTSIGGQNRNQIARLSNDTPALQNLSVTTGTINWILDGSSPQFTRVTFEKSTDGVNYTFLGAGTGSFSPIINKFEEKERNDIFGSDSRTEKVLAPQAVGWTLTGFILPAGQNLWIRARGYYRCGWNNGSESILERVQNVYLFAPVTISGTISYGNAIGAPTPRFVSNVLLSGAGSVPVSAFSSFPSGTYSLSGFGSGAYTLTPSKTGGVNGAISSFDAGKVALHVAGTTVLTGNQLIVADVSGNGTISSFDAGQIARYAAGVPGSGSAGNWIFTPVNRSYASVTGNVTGEDFVALLMGEVSGNWMNTGAMNKAR